MLERGAQHSSEESIAIAHGLVALLQYIHTDVYAGHITSHRIARDIVSLRKGGDTQAQTDLDSQARKHLEIAKITGYFVERIWPKLHQWSEAHPGDFPLIDERSGQMRPATQEELSRLFSNTPYVTAYHVHASVVQNITQRYMRKLEGMLEVAQGSPQGEARIYMRYRDLMQQSYFHRTQYRGDPAQQIGAGFMTGTLFSWALVAQIEPLYEKLTGTKCSDQHVYKLLVQAAEDFVLTISRTWLDVFNVINDTVLEKDLTAPPEKVAYVPILKHVMLRGDPEIGFSFDIDHEGLTHILEQIKKKVAAQDLLHSHATHTMCPALIAAPETHDGTHRKSAITQLFRWCAQQAQTHKVM